MRAYKIATCAVLAMLLADLSACGFGKQPFTEMLWPAPPLTPRIKFVGILRNRDDLGRSATELFAEAVLGKKTPESLVQPMGVAVSRDGKRIYVTDYAKPAVLVFDFEKQRMYPFGSAGTSFQNPLGIAVDDLDNVYIVESVPRRIGVYDKSGNLLRTITHESLERPTGIAVDSVRHRVYVADSASRLSPNHMVRVFGTDGSYIKSFGGVGNEEGKFSFPSYLALDREGNLYVTDTLNGRVQKFDPDSRYLRSFGQYGDAFGMFNKPKGVVLDTFGNLYVVDAAWSNVQIFNQKGEVLLFFGARGRFPGLLFNPTGIAIDKDNRLYVCDAFNSRISIYQLINTTAEDSFATQPPETK
jgi:DNA-binding beta-propeller fold protein YncE